MKKNKNKKSRFGSNVVGDVSRREKASGYGYLKIPNDLPVFKEKVGRVKLDIIPYIVPDSDHPDANPDAPDTAHEGNPWYKRPIYLHHNVGAENETLLCRKTIGKKCPPCEKRDEQFKEGMDKEDVVRKWQLRNLYIVVPKGHKDYDEVMHLWDISNGNFQEELDKELMESPEYGKFPNPDGGLTLNIRFSEASFNNNKFPKASRIDFDKRKKSYDDSIMEEAVVLDELFTVLSYKEIEMKFLEIGEDDIPPEEEVKEDKKSKKRKKKDLKRK